MIWALTSYTCLLQFAFVLTVGQITSHAVFLYFYISIFLYFVFVIVLTCIYTLTDHFPLCGIQFAMDADFWNQSVWFGRRAVWLALINYPMIRYWIQITSIDDPLLINKKKKNKWCSIELGSKCIIFSAGSRSLPSVIRYSSSHLPS